MYKQIILFTVFVLSQSSISMEREKDIMAPSRSGLVDSQKMKTKKSFSLSQAALLSGKIIGLSTAIVAYKCVDKAITIGSLIFNGLVVKPVQFGLKIFVVGLDEVQLVSSNQDLMKNQTKNE